MLSLLAYGFVWSVDLPKHVTTANDLPLLAQNDSVLR